MNDIQRVVFVVDDDESVREALALLIRALGWQVCAFASARECLQAVSEQRPACVVSDLDMPEMNGALLIMELRKRGFVVPVVFVTGMLADSPLIRLATIAGAQAILRKPVIDGELLTAIQLAITSTSIEPVC